MKDLLGVILMASIIIIGCQQNSAKKNSSNIQTEEEVFGYLAKNAITGSIDTLNLGTETGRIWENYQKLGVNYKLKLIVNNEHWPVTIPNASSGLSTVKWLMSPEASKEKSIELLVLKNGRTYYHIHFKKNGSWIPEHTIRSVNKNVDKLPHDWG